MIMARSDQLTCREETLRKPSKGSTVPKGRSFMSGRGMLETQERGGSDRYAHLFINASLGVRCSRGRCLADGDVKAMNEIQRWVSLGRDGKEEDWKRAD